MKKKQKRVFFYETPCRCYWSEICIPNKI